jgi:hypothetical protein
MNSIAPEPVLRASLKVLHIASFTTRNWALDDDVSRQQIYDLWEAIHEIPDLLTRWRPDAERELTMYLKEYDAKWSNPDLQGIYQQALTQQ